MSGGVKLEKTFSAIRACGNERLIARLWRGWTKPENADCYEQLLATKVLPGFDDLNGCKRAFVFRDDRESESEFVTLTFFEDLEPLRRFAGNDYEIAVVPAKARKILARFNEKSKHYEVVVTPS
jgi:heme-degrading monooxygenase HmoA